ncbi:MAG TPA: MMPL family transporter [Thermoanaerobaculia bacterium]|nr:MMPL family transporter [Thermoanaerobaculia bacterium]
MPKQTLQRIALWGVAHYVRIFAAAGVLVAVSLVAASRLQFDSDVLNLLPRDSQVVQTFRHTLEEFGGVDTLLVLVELPVEVAVDPYEAFVEELAHGLEELSQIEYVDYRIGNMEELLETHFPHAFLFLDEEGRRRFEQKLSGEELERRAAEIRRTLATPQSMIAKRLIRIDPIGLADVFLERLSGTRGALRVDLSSGFFLSSDRRLLLLLAKPIHPAQSFAFTEEMVAAVEARSEALLAEWEEIAGSDPPPPPRIELGGNYITALEDAKYIRRDLVVNNVTSTLGVMALFVYAFRRVGLVLYALIPLGTGLVLTFGLMGVTVGALNAVSGATAALLIGLGIDFVIVSYGRYVEERRQGQSIAGALATMNGSTGRAVLSGAVTTAATFWAFTVTDFQGLRQMGFLTGTGILFCLLAVVFLLPAMLAWSEAHHRRRRREPRLYLHGFGTDRLIRFSMRHPRAVLAVAAVVTLLMGGLATRLRFEDSIREMRPRGTRNAKVERLMADHFGSGFDFMMLVLRGDTLEEVLELTAEAVEGAQRFAGTDELVRHESILSILPPAKRQLETLAWLEDRRVDRLDVERVRRVFLEAVEREGMRGEAFADGLELFERAAAVERPISLEDLRVDDASQRLLERFVRRTEHGWTSIVYLHPPPRQWRREAPPSAVRLASELGPRAELSGVNVVSEFMRSTVRRDAVVATLIGLVLVVALLWIDFRRLFDTVASLVPLSVGLVWMLGGMVLLSLSMNFFNVFVTAMIIGLGVDYGVHMIHRYREEKGGTQESLVAGLCETGKAVVLAATATVVGFGSLSLSSYPGIQSIGYVAIMGSSASALVAMSVLPAYLALRLQREDR